MQLMHLQLPRLLLFSLLLLFMVCVSVRCASVEASSTSTNNPASVPAPVAAVTSHTHQGNDSGVNKTEWTSQGSPSDSRETDPQAENDTNSTGREQRRFLDEGTAYVLNSDGTIRVGNETGALEHEVSVVKLFSNESYSIPIRKCCELNQFFSLITQKCEDVEEDTGIDAAVMNLAPYSDANRSISYLSGRLQQCPGSGMLPTISEAKTVTHSVLLEGSLVDHVAQQHFDHNHYCLEIAAQGEDELATGILVLAWCQMWPRQVLARKCCDINEYFDHVHGDCRENNANFTDYEHLVRQFFRTDPLIESIEIDAGRLRCDDGTPKIVQQADAFLDSSGQLCEFHTGHCYPPELYCLENLWAEGDSSLTPVASVCPVDSFHKCCPRNEILSESGCIPSTGVHISARMIQLLEVLEPQYGFPTENGGEVCEQEWVTPDDEDIRWWISKTGYLSVDTRLKSLDTMRYCVDDFLDPDNGVHEVAIMCSSDVEPSVPVPLSAHSPKAGNLPKCCPHRYYFSLEANDCVPDDMGLHLEREPQLQALNVTEMTYTSFPECTDTMGYHHYSLNPDHLDDYAILGEDNGVEVVSTDGRCILSRRPYKKASYCTEYTVNGSDIRPSIMVCARSWSGSEVHTEKFELLAVLLGLSCTALLFTALSLISTRVRRGLVTVKKVKTLAGRILLSYVMSYLVGFLLLAVNMKVEVTQENPECYLMAGLLIFFLLAAFQWNTSICLESLLLTLRVSTTEGCRYLLHSLWAWGVPGFITALALILDAHRQDLPCGVITPRIGVYRCFFSDPDAKMLYLYVPMLISLLANCALLLAARYVRSAKLRRLEMGPAGRNNRGGGAECEGSEMQQQNGSHKRNSKKVKSGGSQRGQQQAPHSSGLRTHQTRNLWSESVKLVIWSGGTWLLEVVSFVVARYGVMPSESWYDYLWYVPSSVNALRGVGIFFILVFTPENRLKLSRWLTKMGLLSLAKNVRSSDGTRSTTHHRSSVVGSQTESTEVRPGRGGRNMSIATVITQVSQSIKSSQSNTSQTDSNGVGRGSAHPNLGPSVSQTDTRRSSLSSQSSDFEGYELDTDVGPCVGAGGRRRSSLAALGTSLPSVHEEDHIDDLSVMHDKNTNTGSTSDA